MAESTPELGPSLPPPVVGPSPPPDLGPPLSPLVLESSAPPPEPGASPPSPDLRPPLSPPDLTSSAPPTKLEALSPLPDLRSSLPPVLGSSQPPPEEASSSELGSPLSPSVLGSSAPPPEIEASPPPPDLRPSLPPLVLVSSPPPEETPSPDYGPSLSPPVLEPATPLPELGPLSPLSKLGPLSPLSKPGPLSPLSKPGPLSPLSKLGPSSPLSKVGPSLSPPELVPSSPPPGVAEFDFDEEFELHPELAPVEFEPEHKVLRQYYEENDFLLATEGILKVLSVVACLVVAGLYLGSGACQQARGLVAGSTSVALAAAGGVALLYAGAALQLPVLAPQAWFYADIIVSTVMGILLLVTAVLSLVFCDLDAVSAYLLAPLGAAAAALVVASVGIMYGEVTRRWDAARPAVEPPRPTTTEQDA